MGKKFNIRIAGLTACVEHEYSHTPRLCADYTVSDSDAADILARASEEDICEERGRYDEEHAKGYCESICIYRSIAEQLPFHDSFVFHGAAVEIDGRGVVFTAPSGTGKTTHIDLLMANFPDRVKIINGDKPILRRINGEWRVFSTPWAGKEGMQRNTDAALYAIVFLSRSEENYITDADPAEIFGDIIKQVYYPKSSDALLATFDLLDQMSGAVRFMRMGCNISKNAAEMSFAALKK